VYVREPSVNLGIGAMQGKTAASGRPRLSRSIGIRPDSADATLQLSRFREIRGPLRQARGFAHLKTLVEAPARRRRTRTLRCCSMAAICGRDRALRTPCRAPTWSKPRTCSHRGDDRPLDSPIGEKALRSNLERFKGEFLAQNVFLTEEAAFNNAKHTILHRDACSSRP